MTNPTSRKNIARAARIVREWADPLCRDAIEEAFATYFEEHVSGFDVEAFSAMCAGSQA